MAPEVAAAQRLAAAIPDLLLARARDRLAHLAVHDGLTGLPNRELLFARIEAALRDAASAKRRVALLFIDLDRFKLVNDTLVTASIGIAVTEAKVTADELLHDADIAMYRDKRRGRAPEPVASVVARDA